MAEVHDTVEKNQESDPKKRIRWRRHSFSSVHMQSLSAQTQLKDTTQSQSSTLSRDRRHHSSSVEPTASSNSTKSHKIGGSFFKIFRSKSIKNRRVQHTSSQELDDDKPPILLERKNDYIRVVATELHPRIQYKTLPITEYTTAYEVVVKLVTKFATSEEDRDRPDLFYLNEEHESEQGKYSHMLENNERVHAIQSRWTDGDKKYSFVLCRKQKPLLEDNTFLQPMSAVVLSPSQDSFYNALPGLITVEEGAMPSSQTTEHLMNTYFQPSSLPNGQRIGGPYKHGVHSQTPAIATTSIGAGAINMEGSRVDVIRTTTEEPSTTVTAVGVAHSSQSDSPGELSAKEANAVEILSNNAGHQLALTGEGRVDQHDDKHSQPAEQQQQQANGGSSKASDKPGEMNYRQLMQRSISQGMPGIMNKVINESKQDSNVVLVPTSAQIPASAESSSLPQTGSIATDNSNCDKQTSSLSRVKPLHHSPGMGRDKREGRNKVKLAPENITLRALVCSPMEAASRKFPEFVFAPGTDESTPNANADSETNSKEMATGGDDGGDKNQTRSSQIVLSKASLSTVSVNEGKGELHSRGKPVTVDGSKCDTNLKPLARKLEFDYENSNQVKSKSGHLETKICNQNSKKLGANGTPPAAAIHHDHDQGPYAHHSTATRSTLPVMAETTLTISFKYHSRASLYPSFLRSAYYSTEMDIMESLHTLLDMKFKKKSPSIEQEKRQPSTRNGPTTESLMDEARKSHLIFSKETPKKAANVSLKRPHSFHYRRTKSDDAESANLESPVKREFLMRKAAEAVRQRKKKSFGEKESDLDTLIEEQRSKPRSMNGRSAVVRAAEQSSRQVPGSSSDRTKSMENLTMTNAQYHSSVPEESNPGYTQKQISSRSCSLHALPTRHLSFRDSSSSSQRTSQRRALPRRSKSFHESSKSSQSLEALHTKSGLLREDGDEELLYIFERKKRPVTVLVRSNSSLSVHNDQTSSAEAKLLSLRMKYQASSNLMTTKASSSQGLALSEITEDPSGNRLAFEGVEQSQKRYSRNRPTSAPSERPSQQSRAGSGTSADGQSSGLDELMSSIYLKADKLWWNEL